MDFSLRKLLVSELQDIAAARVPARLGARLEPGALPPAFVAERALGLHAKGHPEPWSTIFLIVRDRDQQIVGSCGFKTPPTHGQVEVGYGVAEATRGQGAATDALCLLVAMAFAAGASSILAEVVPDNHASAEVVRRNGFIRTGDRIDESGEYVVQWMRSREN